MSISVLVASGNQVHFGSDVSVSKNVGTGANRYAIVLSGYSATPGAGGGTPNGATVGSDTLTLQGSVTTVSPGSTKWAVYAGALTVTGTQTIDASFSGSITSGFANIVVLVLQGDAALTPGTFLAVAEFQAGSAANESVTVTGTSNGDVVFEIWHDIGFSSTPTPQSPSVVITNDGGPPGPGCAKQASSGGSITMQNNWNGAVDTIRTAVAISEFGAGGGANQKLPIDLGVY